MDDYEEIIDEYQGVKKQKSWSSYEKSWWISVVFEHPAIIETLALDPKLKKDITDD